jgi:hypothetical protein
MQMPSHGTVPGARTGAGIACSDEKIYIWGMTFLEDVPENKKLYMYDLNTALWNLIPSSNFQDDWLDERGNLVAAVYDGYYYAAYGACIHSGDQAPYFVRIPITGGEWEKMPYGQGIELTMAAYVMVNSSLWIICGSNEKGMKNSVYRMNFETQTFETIIESKFAIERIKSYTLFRIGSDLLQFGGTDETQAYYLFRHNLLYRFDTLTESWELMIPNGTPPEPRYDHCATVYNGIYLVVFGGHDFNGNYFGDFFMYNLKTNTWKQIVTDVQPAGRYNCCMNSMHKFIVVHGGITSSAVTDELLVLDMHQNTLRTVTIETSLSLAISNHACWFDSTDEHGVELTLASGQDENGTPLSMIVSVSFNIYNTEKIGKAVSLGDTYELVNWASAGILPMNKWYMILGGSQRSLYSSRYVYMVNYTEHDNIAFNLMHDIDETHKYMYDHDVEQFLGDFYVGYSGTAYAYMMQKLPIISQFYKVSPSNDSEIAFFPCSTGTMFDENENCVLCPLGSYQENIGATDCTLCPPGTYSKDIAASSIFQCFPCKFGYYTTNYGSQDCFSCEDGSYCPVGSKAEVPYVSYPEMLSSQPPAYSAVIPDPFQGYDYSLVYGTASLLIISYILFSQIRKKIKKIDFFSTYHDSGIDKPIMKRKTPMGGFASIVFLAFSLVYITTNMLSYYYGNIVETKSLVPVLTLSQAISTDCFNITVELLYYPGECIDTNNANYPNGKNCSDFLYYNFNNLDGNVHCDLIGTTCAIYFDCDNCSIYGSGSLSYKFCEFESLASAIRVTMSADSSIPGYRSEVSFYVGYSTGTVFRGETSTNFYYEVTPSVSFTQLFESSVSDWPAAITGYHIGKASPPVEGSTLAGDE